VVKIMSQRQRNSRQMMSRRDFAQRAALVAAGAAALSPSWLAAEEKKSTAAAAATASPPATAHADSAAAPQAPLAPALQAEAEARIDAIFRKYGERLTEAQKTEIRRLVNAGMPGLEPFRAFALDNGDEPATVLHLYRREA
jgi:hypothetical protein